jgi:hypothetical protein
MNNNEFTVRECVNCNNTIKSFYCENCGEKIVQDKDFSIKTLLNQVVSGLFNFDSKIIKSFYYLFTKPGRLSVNYVNGLRKPFMSPFQIFLIANILFFILLDQADILRIPSKYYFGNEEMIEALRYLSVETDMSELELKNIYDIKSLNYSKSFVIILIPIYAFVFYVLNKKKQYQFGKHLIFATHYFSFFLLFYVILLSIPFYKTPLVIQASIFTINFVYLIFAIRTFYENTIGISVLKGFISVIAIIAFAVMYRGGISDITFNFFI